MRGEIKVGSGVHGMRDGKAAAARVVALDSKEATLDFNHPLAGKTLTFWVKVVSVEN